MAFFLGDPVVAGFRFPNPSGGLAKETGQTVERAQAPGSLDLDFVRAR
jgi:hypothetical protein